MGPSHLGRWALCAALGSLAADAHPTFRGRILSRDTDVLSSYDYVVVGGGASGLTVANRLTENPGKLHCRIIITSQQRKYQKG